MSKAKRFYTRRTRTLRKAAIALAMLLFCNVVLHLGFLLPRQPLRFAEQRSGVYEPTRVIAAQWRAGLLEWRWPGWKRPVDCLYLTEGANTLTLCDVYPSLLGWMGGYAFAIDCSDGAPTHVGWVAMSNSEDDQIAVFYGRLDVGADEIVWLTLRGEPEWEREGLYAFEGFEAGRDALFTRNGQTYLLFVIKKGELPISAAEAYQLVAETADGERVYDIEAMGATFWG